MNESTNKKDRIPICSKEKRIKYRFEYGNFGSRPLPSVYVYLPLNQTEKFLLSELRVK